MLGEIVCRVQLKVAFFLAKEHSLHGRRFVPLERIYQALCPNNDETCKATVRKALNALVKQGLVEKHRKARNKREYRLAGELFELWKSLDEVYRYG